MKVRRFKLADYVVTEIWKIDGHREILHREDGPALVGTLSNKWYLNGIRYSRMDYFVALKKYYDKTNEDIFLIALEYHA